MTIEEIQAAIAAVFEAAEGRDLTDDEATQIEGYEKDLEEAQAKRDRTEAFRARQAERAKIATPALHVSGKPKDNDETATLDHAFLAYMRTGRENADIAQLRNAQSEGVGSEGGYTVPDSLRQKIVERMVAFGGLANVVEEITTDSGNNLSWLVLGDDSANRGEIVAEGGTFSGGADLTFSQANLGAYSYMAGGAGGTPLRVSRELAQDSSVNIEALVSRKLGERAARLQAEHIVSGSGVSEPQGIITGRTPVETAATTGGITYADLLEWVHSIDPAYRNGNCRWAFNDATLQAIRGILDDNGRPVVKGGNDSIAGAPGGETLLGYPVTIDQAFPDFDNDDSTDLFGVFGDLREGYVIRRVRSIELLVNPYSRMQYRQIEYSAWFRMDAVQQNTNAYIALSGNS